MADPGGGGVVDCLQDLGGCAGDAIANSAMGSLAEGLKEGAKELIEKSVGWWITVDPIDLASSPAVKIRQWTMFIAGALAVGSMMWVLAQAAYRRRSEGLWDAGGGLLKLVIVAGMTGAGGFILPQILMDMSDAFAEFVLDEAVTDRILSMTAMTGITSPGLIIVLAIILMVVGFVQALLMFLRDGAIVILSGLLVLAAAGGMTPLTKGWWPKLTGTLLALIWYRAAAALVWSTALAFMDGGATDDPVQSFFIGIALFLASLFALGAMTKFFSWGVASAAGGGGGLLAAAGMGAYALSQRGGGVASGPTASQQAASLRSDMGGGGGGGGQATIVGISGGSGSPSGAASSGVASAGAAAAPVTGGASMAAAGVAQAGIHAAQAAKDKSVGTMTGGDV